MKKANELKQASLANQRFAVMSLLEHAAAKGECSVLLEGLIFDEVASELKDLGYGVLRFFTFDPRERLTCIDFLDSDTDSGYSHRYTEDSLSHSGETK